MEVLPYSFPELGKKREVALMFDNIARRYYFLNHLLSLNIDRFWRRRAISHLRNRHPRHILDVATGTGDFAVAALRLNPEKITGIDLSGAMMEKGKQKILAKKLGDKIDFFGGDAEVLPFKDASFDAVLCGFGVRNFEDPGRGIREMYRVLKNSGQAVILEFSKPVRSPFRQIYNIYFSSILPRIGKVVSGDPQAYRYLPESVDAFPEGEQFLEILRDSGFSECGKRTLTFGVATVYYGMKVQSSFSGTQ